LSEVEDSNELLSEVVESERAFVGARGVNKNKICWKNVEEFICGWGESVQMRF
jgi:hypothetical protein